jgi:hypothetical protein
MAASIYMILGRIIQLTDGEQHSLINQRWLTKIFVTGDVVAVLLQPTGGALLAMANPTNNFSKVGEEIIIVGLFVQLVMFGFFVAAAAVFHRRMALVQTASAARPEVRWPKYLLTLYLTSVLIWVRSK